MAHRRTLVAGLKIARGIVGNSALDRYRAFEMNPGDQCQSDVTISKALDDQRRDFNLCLVVVGSSPDSPLERKGFEPSVLLGCNHRGSSPVVDWRPPLTGETLLPRPREELKMLS